MRTPKDDPDPRPLLDRIEDDAELIKALHEWVVPTFDLIEDADLRARCLLLIGYVSGRIIKR